MVTARALHGETGEDTGVELAMKLHRQACFTKATALVISKCANFKDGKTEDATNLKDSVKAEMMELREYGYNYLDKVAGLHPSVLVRAKVAMTPKVSKV